MKIQDYCRDYTKASNDIEDCHEEIKIIQAQIALRNKQIESLNEKIGKALKQQAEAVEGLKAVLK